MATQQQLDDDQLFQRELLEMCELPSDMLHRIGVRMRDDYLAFGLRQQTTYMKEFPTHFWELVWAINDELRERGAEPFLPPLDGDIVN